MSCGAVRDRWAIESSRTVRLPSESAQPLDDPVACSPPCRRVRQGRTTYFSFFADGTLDGRRSGDETPRVKGLLQRVPRPCGAGDRLNPAAPSCPERSCDVESAGRVHSVRSRVLAAHNWEFATDGASRANGSQMLRFGKSSRMLDLLGKARMSERRISVWQTAKRRIA
jgi:hypothetical protein